MVNIKSAITKAVRVSLVKRLRPGRLLSRIILFLLFIGLSYIILYPFFFKIAASFMTRDDLYDTTVTMISREFTLEHYINFIKHDDFTQGAFNTAFFAVVAGVLSVVSASLVGYGLAQYRFRGRRLIFILVVVTMLIPSITLTVPLYAIFRYFDPFGLITLIKGSPGINDTIWPLIILSSTGLGFRSGVYIILMRQYFLGVPGEIIEAAKVDGAGHLKTFLWVVMPMANSMMIVIFMLAFAWQWTDTFYSSILFTNTKLLKNIVLNMVSTAWDNPDRYFSYVQANAALLLTILPILVIYVIFQRRIIEGVERSGLVG